MALTGEEIKHRLAAFAAHWSVYDRSERAEAQTFLNELFECYGTHRADVATFEEPQAGRFLDLIWPQVCLVEMKAPAEAGRLERHREQAFDYWRNAADPAKSIRAPQFVVICAFRRMEIWEPGAFPGEPRIVLDLIELPERYDALLFLARREPVFTGHEEDVTREAVAQITDLFTRLGDRIAAGPDVLRDFLLQCVWCMFAEDLGLLEAHLFTRLIEDLRDDRERSSADDLGQLFVHLNDPATARPSVGLYRDVPYANGGLFTEPARVHLEPEELDLLRAACGFDWRKVQPQIFGSLLEGALGHEKQWALGAHYTHEADIQKIVQPTVVRPWRERIENLATHAQAIAAQNDLMRYVVLDPACGSGNFLYVAYRELRRLEARLRERERALRKRGGMADQGALALFFPIGNVKGIEIDAFAVSLARVTLWMGHKLAVDEIGAAEATLPLADLSGIRQGDALRIDWPRADAIIGNPPFHGDRNLRRELGDDYVEWLQDTFNAGIKDYCVYWFRKAHDHLAPRGRAGLVGTNSVSQNRARGASLDYIVTNGGVITDAVSKQPWPGDAIVNVSIVNWTKEPAEVPVSLLLDGVEVDGISTALRSTRTEVSSAVPLVANEGRCFFGPIPGGKGFILAAEEAETLLQRNDADYRDVVRPYLVGRDIAIDPGQAPSRFIIDFAFRTLEEAMSYPGALEIVRERVKPVRDRVRRQTYRRYWWRFAEPLRAMRQALAPLRRYITSVTQGKRLLFCWNEPWTCPSNLTTVFAFEDDYAMGVLSSQSHGQWARKQSSTLRVDLRYTPTTAFMTFPWPPAPGRGEKDAVGKAAASMIVRRGEICAAQQIGLTTLYNQVDEGAWEELKELHRQLDAAVVAAYGWPASIAQDAEETNRRLLELNREIAEGRRDYRPFPEK